MRSACDQVARRISEVHAQDVEHQRGLERAAMAEQSASDLLDLAEAASLLRDVIDAVQRDTLEALLDEPRFATIKAAALERIDEISEPKEARAVAAGVGGEFAEFKRAVMRTVAALPFPKEVFAGIDDARASYERSVLASFPLLADAIARKDFAEAFRVASSLRGRITHEALLQEVADIADQRLQRLKSGYASWWRANARMMNESLRGLQRALMRAQTRNAIQLARDRLAAAEESNQ